MYGAHGQVEPAQQPLGQIERAVLEDLDLRRLEQEGMALQLVIQTFDLVELLAQAPRAEATRCLCPVGDGHVLVASLKCGHSQPAQPSLIAGGAVDAQVPAEIALLDQVRQSPLYCRLDLSPVLPQLRLDVRQPDECEHLALAAPAEALVVAEHAIFVELQPGALCEPANRDAVRLRAGEVAECRAVTFLPDHAQVDLQT